MGKGGDDSKFGWERARVVEQTQKIVRERVEFEDGFDGRGAVAEKGAMGLKVEGDFKETRVDW